MDDLNVQRAHQLTVQRSFLLSIMLFGLVFLLYFRLSYSKDLSVTSITLLNKV